MSEWKEYILEDVIDKFIDYRGKTPKKTPSGIPLVTAKVVKNGTIKEPNEFISVDDYDDWMTRGFPKIDDVVLTTEAPLGEVALIKDANIALAQRIITLRGNPKILFNPFLKYYFQSRQGQYLLQSRASGTTVFGIKSSVLKKLPINLPPLPEQRAIASVLSSLDDKIDLLHRQKKTMEAMAETLFREWFVEGVEESWEEGVLEDLVEVKYGKAHKKLLEGTIPVYGSGGIMRYAEKALYEKESVLIPRKGTLNNVVYINEPFWTVDTMFYTIMKKNNIAKFVFHFVKGKNLAAMNVGSAVPSMTTKVLNAMPLQIPPDKFFENFEKTVSPWYEKVKSNINQIRTLENLRDTLLPKLMSGKIRIATNG